MVEMAIVLPILLALVFGIIEFGNIYSHQLELNNLVRHGVRAAVVSTPDKEGEIKEDMVDMMPGVDEDDITIEWGGNRKVTVVYDCPLITGQIIGIGTKHLTAEATMKAEG